MAVTWSDQSLRFTAAADGVDDRFRCKTITIRPSTTAWVVIIKDLDGAKTKFEASGAANESYIADVEGTIFNGAVLSTATNLTSVTFNNTEHIYNASVAVSG
jgi:hypothetical protein